VSIKHKPLRTLQQETQRQRSLLLKLHAQQQIALHRQLQPLKARPIAHCQQQEKHKLAVMQTAIAWNACSRGHSPSSK
jgi:hypothetical protein